MISIPKTLDQVRDRWIREEREPNERKTVEFAMVLRATSAAVVAEELESMAARLRTESASVIDWVGHGVGRNFTTAYAAIKLKS